MKILQFGADLFEVDEPDRLRGEANIRFSQFCEGA